MAWKPKKVEAEKHYSFTFHYHETKNMDHIQFEMFIDKYVSSFAQIPKLDYYLVGSIHVPLGALDPL
jgi:hypothetical protein